MRVGLVLSILCLCCGTAIRAQETDWGNWKATPNFAGIQIRSRCQSHSSSEGVSDWNYQIRSSYKERVYLTYKDEERTSTPSHIVFGTPDSFYLNPGEESPVHDDYVTGDCNRDGGVYIEVVSVENGSGETAPSSGAASSSAGAAERAAKGSESATATGANSLVGEWTSKNASVSATWLISADGAWSLRFVHISDGKSVELTGRWSQSGKDSITVADAENKLPPTTLRSTDATHAQWIMGAEANSEFPVWERAPGK